MTANMTQLVPCLKYEIYQNICIKDIGWFLPLKMPKMQLE